MNSFNFYSIKNSIGDKHKKEWYAVMLCIYRRISKYKQ